MKTTILTLAMAALIGCAGGQPVLETASSAPAATITEEDILSQPSPVPEKEAEQVVSSSFPGATTECAGDGEDIREGAWARSSIRGSFTRPGVAETIYSVQLSRCNDLQSAPKKHVLLIYMGGKEVWRTEAPEAVRAKDVDGDGRDEWVEVYKDENVVEAWVQGWRDGKAVTIAHDGMR